MRALAELLVRMPLTADTSFRFSSQKVAIDLALFSKEVQADYSFGAHSIKERFITLSASKEM